MKKLIAIVSALLLVLSLSQCKKKPTVAADDVPESVSITLDVNGGSKVLVTPATGDVAFESGDVIYVAYKGKYVGTITHNGSYFSGSISATPDGVTPLYFYFLGNQPPYESLTEGTSTSISVDIIDQTTTLPVISAAASDAPFTGAGSYTAKLANKCALAKFAVTSNTNEYATCIYGLNNKVDIDFAQGDEGFTYSIVGSGVIKLVPGSGERWAILLPQTGIECSAYSANYELSGSVGTIIGSLNNTPTPGIVYANNYITMGVSVSLTAPFNVLEGAIKCLYSVSPTKQVFFSQGNLKYQASTGTWKFHDNQNDIIGSLNENISSSYAGWIDLFGYGTSGYNDLYPYTIIENNNTYPSSNINTTNYDWGYNSISNGGNEAGLWRTLTTTEWIYLFNNYRFVLATVGGVKGLILLPEFWETETYSLNNIKYPNFTVLGLQYTDVRYSDNTIPYDDFHNYFEVYGAVFFPAAGKRVGIVYKSETSAFYFSSSIVKGNLRVVSISPIDKTDRFKFMSHNGVTVYYEGRSVRLVTDYN